jgi:hypothetical protein
MMFTVWNTRNKYIYTRHPMPFSEAYNKFWQHKKINEVLVKQDYSVQTGIKS